MFAITTTDYDLVKVLLDHGADPNMTDKVNVIVVTPEMQNFTIFAEQAKCVDSSLLLE
jgi:hypothetical protein